MACVTVKSGKATILIADGEVPVVELNGEVDYQSASTVRDTLRDLVGAGRKVIGIRCPEASFIDSSGISALANSARDLKGLGGGLRLLDVTKQLRHALEISGFISLFDLGSASFVFSDEPARKAGRMWQSSSFSIPASADTDGTIRRRITELARSMPFSEEEVEDIQLASGEAVANAYRHGIRDRDHDRISVRCIGDENGLIVEITNPGPRFDPDSIPLPDPLNPREGGMGIFFMRQCMDSVEYIFDESGTTVKMVKSLRNHQGGIVDNHNNGHNK